MFLLCRPVCVPLCLILSRFLLLCLHSVLLMKAVGTLGDAGYFSSSYVALTHTRAPPHTHTHTHTHTHCWPTFPGLFPLDWFKSVVTETYHCSNTHTKHAQQHTNRQTHTHRCVQLPACTERHVDLDKVINE